LLLFFPFLFFSLGGKFDVGSGGKKGSEREDEGWKGEWDGVLCGGRKGRIKRGHIE